MTTRANTTARGYGGQHQKLRTGSPVGRIRLSSVLEMRSSYPAMDELGSRPRRLRPSIYRGPEHAGATGQQPQERQPHARQASQGPAPSCSIHPAIGSMNTDAFFANTAHLTPESGKISPPDGVTPWVGGR